MFMGWHIPFYVVLLGFLVQAGVIAIYTKKKVDGSWRKRLLANPEAVVQDVIQYEKKSAAHAAKEAQEELEEAQKRSLEAQKRVGSA